MRYIESRKHEQGTVLPSSYVNVKNSHGNKVYIVSGDKAFCFDGMLFLELRQSCYA